MLLSIVTGSYNRIALLTRMVDSVRRYLHRGIAYEIIVVDGGSNDGTIEWCQAQSDIKLIAHGELRGAIRAFCDGAYAATGDYVLLCNDDVELLDSSILRAIAYLETTPTCGAVAFADDRKATGKPDGFHVQTMSALTPDGRHIHVPYAQVGLFRRWLGNLCGWWGADDTAFKSHTYGGDNYLTARILEYGYSVDAVTDVRVKDIVARDGLREINISKEKETIENGGGYYARFPIPPMLRGASLGGQQHSYHYYDYKSNERIDYTLSTAVDNPDRGGSLRILYLPIFETKIYPHHPIMKRGLREALQAYGHVVEVDYLNTDFDLCALVHHWQPDILFTQCQRNPIDLTQARALCPNMLVLNWNGDVYLDALIDDVTLNWLKHNIDVQLVVNAKALERYNQHGIKSAYWQCGYEPVNEQYTTNTATVGEIVFMGSAYSQRRHDLARMLTQLPYHVKLIGTGWVNYPDHNGGNTTYEFEVTNAIRRAAKIEVGDNQYPEDLGFVSNRMFDCMAAGGALLLHQHVPHLEEYTGLKAGVHYVEWHDYNDLQEAIKFYMDKRRDKQRAKIVKAAYEEVRAHHSFAARLRQLFEEILPEVL